MADPVDPNLMPIVEQARVDLMERTGVAAEAVEVVLAEAVVWPDASLGCPQPDMIYAQVLREGARVVLRTGDKLYTYHTGGDQVPFLCAEPNY